MRNQPIRHWGPTRAAWTAAALVLAAPAATFTLLRLAPSRDVALGSGSSHFYIVSAVAALALVLAVAVIWAARRLPDARTFFLAMGFVAMATIFLAHGLGTSPWFVSHAESHGDPFEADEYSYVEDDGYGLGYHEQHATHTDAEEYGYGGYGGAAGPVGGGPDATAIARLKVVGYSAQLSLFVSALFFALSTRRVGEATARLVLRRQGVLLVACTAVLAGHVFASLFFPQVLSGLPIGEPWLRYPIAFVAIALMAVAGVRFLQAYRLALLPLQGAMALGMALLIEAQVFMVWGEVWRLSWWEYHVVMLIGFLVPVVSLLVQYRVAGDLGVIVEGLFLRHQVNGIRAGDPQAMTVLAAAAAAKDSETSEHIERVGELSVDIGRYLGLPGDRLEVLRWAGRLHDVGKIGVPNSILRKASGLSPGEREIMKLHSPRGGNIALNSGALGQAAAIIRAHHERVDGRGYPDGLVADEIPLEARIVAVADVWDALTSDRPYRKAMPATEAADILQQEAGPHLDPHCVEALFALLQIGLPRAGAA